jgi:hypothetical protein
VTDKAVRVRVFVLREANGYLLLVTSDRSLLHALNGDTITEQDVWIEVES